MDGGFKTFWVLSLKCLILAQKNIEGKPHLECLIHEYIKDNKYKQGKIQITNKNIIIKNYLPIKEYIS